MKPTSTAAVPCKGCGAEMTRILDDGPGLFWRCSKCNSSRHLSEPSTQSMIYGHRVTTWTIDLGAHDSTSPFLPRRYESSVLSKDPEAPA